MPAERAFLARAKPYALTTKASALVEAEIGKGCRGEIAPRPVALEPPYAPTLSAQSLRSDAAGLPWVYEEPSSEKDMVRLRLWISPDQDCAWNRSEIFLKQLSHLHHRAALEIVGNADRITLAVLCHRHDVPVIRAAFLGQFERCQLTTLLDDGLTALYPSVWSEAAFLDFYPPPPYSHRFTSPEELRRSPYTALFGSLAELPAPCVGVYQVVFAPVSPEHDWHRNVQQLVDIEFAVKLIGGLPNPFRFAQQSPSGDLRQMAADAETKAHNDKPFFAAALRIAVCAAGDGEREALLRSLCGAAALIQHGGRPLQHVDATAYRERLGPEGVRRMFDEALTFRPGFLLNSRELSSLVHIPPPDMMEPCGDAVLLETLPATEELSEGTPIGFSDLAGVRRPVCIPDGLRCQHVHLAGRTGRGKSTAMEHMILHDIQRGHGLAVLDPHGRLVQRLLYLIPREHVDRVIYIDPGDPEWVPIWNPLRCRSGQPPGRVADDLVGAFKSFVTGWGDRMEHLLRQALLAVLQLPHGSLLDVSNLLRKKSDESRRLRREVLKVVDDELSRLFWRYDFDRYSPTDLAPGQHKLSKLLTSGTVSLMLSQPDSAFDFQDLVESDRILLVDLSTIGSEVREILGCFQLALLHLAALGRGSLEAETRRPFHIYCDEVHRFLTDAIEDLIAETRKFNVSLTLAHQYMSQFSARKTDALSNVGSMLAFQLDTKDAQHLRKDLQGLVEVEDLITLEVGHAIARIDNHVVRLETRRPLPIPDGNSRQEIIDRSRARYYRPVRDVRRAVRDRESRWREPLSAGVARIEQSGDRPGEPQYPEAFAYDEF